jgi:hypothetical protein
MLSRPPSLVEVNVMTRPSGLQTGSVLAFFGGTPFLCIYLLIESKRSGGNVRALLLGSRQHGR